MKLIASFIFLTLAVACTSEDATPVTPANPIDIDFENVTPLKTGMFTGIGGHTVSGTVNIYEVSAKKYIVFDPYTSQNGPDLKVYLSKNETAAEYIRIGKLMAITGKQVYELPGNTDLVQYPFVHIWCEKFSVEFGRAPIK